MRNALNSDEPPAGGAKGGRLPKFPRLTGAVATVVILAIAALVWKAHIAPPPGPTAQTSAEVAAAKAAARAMTFTQSPEPNK